MILTVKTAVSVAPVTAEPTPVAAPQAIEAQPAEAAPQAAAAPLQVQLKLQCLTWA